MYLVWLLCVSLLLGGLAFLRRAGVAPWRCGWLVPRAVPILAVTRSRRGRNPARVRRDCRAPFWPPPRVVTRAGP